MMICRKRWRVAIAIAIAIAIVYVYVYANVICSHAVKLTLSLFFS